MVPETLSQDVPGTAGRVRTVLLKSLNETPTGILTNGRVPVELLPLWPIDKADGGDELHGNLDVLLGTVHLLIGFGHIFGIGRYDKRKVLLLRNLHSLGIEHL